MTPEQSAAMHKVFINTWIVAFKGMTTDKLADTLQIHLNLYKQGKANPIHFAIMLGVMSTAFMEKINEQAIEEEKLHKAQPNPSAN